jgi:3-methylfumaryl-CoA hydratase
MGDGTALAHHLDGWAPAAQRWTGQVTGWSVAAFAGLLDQPDPTADDPVVPPMWHLFGLLAHPAQDELGADGHPADGPFLPPIPDRRRMFAGGRWWEATPLPVDRPVEATSEVTGTRVTSGRSGEMAFVTVRTRYAVDGRVHVVEEQDLVYRSQPDPPKGTTPPARATPAAADPVPDEPPAEHELTLDPDPTLLFRFSALTYNAHRIHYDLPYATGVEGYPNLVVHGPLLALLALELPRRHRPGRRIGHVAYRLRRPAFAGAPVVARSRPGETGGESELVVSVAGSPASLTATAAPGPATPPE